MRLLCTIPDKTSENALAFSYYLKTHGIENECEEMVEKEGVKFRIWVKEEDDVAEAERLYAEYKTNPKDHKYHIQYITPLIKAEKEAFEGLQEELEDEIPEQNIRKKRRPFLAQAPYGPISTFILFAVVIIFFWSQMQRDNLSPPAIPGVIKAPTLAPIDNALLIDYPAYFQMRDKLLKIYTREDIENKEPPSTEARILLQEMRQTPVWMGIYEKIVDYFSRTNSTISYEGPFLEKVHQGEVWRLFTPVLLHADLLHIFFNVLWFILLANQIEYRLGSFRYILLILATGIIPNIAQYFMSGPFFMGLSGVVVGLAAFIWARQQVAPWEGYLLQRFTLAFLTIFVLGMFALQLIFFVMQIFGTFETAFSIANTAHIVGGLVGYSLGRLRFFSIRPSLRS